MMVVMALLSVIVIGLMAMFGQVQKAFRGSMTQTDVLESGRAAADMLSRDLVGVIPSYQSQVTNFYAQIPPIPNPAITQSLPGAGGVSRINVLEKFFVLTRENQTWIGYGYLVDDNGSGIGTLYRYLATTNVSQSPLRLLPNFPVSPSASTNWHRVMDGVVQFRIRAFATNGVFLTSLVTNNMNNMTIVRSTIAPGEIDLYVFRSNAVPAYVEFELGILEPRAYERFKALPSSAQKSYLQNQVGRVHMFRQRVPVRAVDATAYQ
jgi:hypothetical protein